MVRLKEVKLKRKHLNMDLEDLMSELGAVVNRRAYPQHVFFSKEDYDTLYVNFCNSFKKQRKELSRKHVESAAGYAFLMFGPSTMISNAVRKGYAVIDVGGIEANAALDQVNDENEKKATVYRLTTMDKIKGFFKRNFGAPTLQKEEPWQPPPF